MSPVDMSLCVSVAMHCVMLYFFSCPQLTAADTGLQPPPLKKNRYHVSCSLLLIIPKYAACAHNTQMQIEQECLHFPLCKACSHFVERGVTSGTTSGTCMQGKVYP